MIPTAGTRHRSVRASVAVLGVFTAVASACGAPGTLPTPAGVRAKVDTIWYDVDGITPREWNESMNLRAPLAGVTPRFHAETRWSTRWEYASTRRAMTGCEAVNPVSDVQVTFIVPRLRSDSLVSPEARAEWRRFSTSLWTHETGHAARAMRAAAVQLERVRQLRTPRCEEFGVEAQRAASAAVARYIALNREYDERTQHGRRQGATLIVNPLIRLSVDTTYRDTVP